MLVDVKIGSTTALAAAIDLDGAGDRTRVSGTLSATASARKGSATDVINVHATTDGSGDLDYGMVVVTIRPRGLAGDVNEVLAQS